MTVFVVCGYRGLHFKMFIYGNMEFLYCMYGLSGTAGKFDNRNSYFEEYTILLNHTGRHCCLWCIASKSEMQTPLSERGRLQLRSLEHLKEYYSKFQAAGGNIKKAKEYYNVIRPHFFEIDPQ